MRTSPRTLLEFEYQYMTALINADWNSLAQLKETAVAIAQSGDIEFAALAIAIDEDMRAAWPTP